jgi:excisionase family DNA binding protein
MMKEIPKYLTPRQAADWFGLSVRTLDRYRASGEGPAFHRFGGRIRYLREDLQAWADARRHTSTAADGGGDRPES